MRTLLILVGAASMISAQGFSVGTAQVTISPHAGTPMAGYYATEAVTTTGPSRLPQDTGVNCRLGRHLELRTALREFARELE